MHVGAELLEQFLPRDDHYIGLLELVAPLLALGTWREIFCNVLWTAFIDNSGALHALLKGSSKSPEANVMVGRMWLNLCCTQTVLFCQRVESKANIADGPTRHDFSEVSRLGATFVEPKLPAFVKQLWHSVENPRTLKNIDSFKRSGPIGPTGPIGHFCLIDCFCRC